MTATWLSSGGKPFNWEVKPSKPEVDWSNPLCNQLAFDANYFAYGGKRNIESAFNLQSTITGTTPIVGPWGAARGFAGGASTDSDIYTIPSSTLNTNDLLTVEAVAFLSAYSSGGGFGRLIDKGGTFRIYLEDGASAINFLQNYASGDTQYSYSFPTGQWVHLVMTWNLSSGSNSPKVWQNGVPVSLTNNQTASGARSADGTTVGIGNVSAQTRSWNGRILYVRTWNRILSPGEVVSLYTNPWQIYKKPTLTLRLQDMVTVPGGNTYSVSMSESGSAAETLSSLATLVANDNETGAAADTVTNNAIQGVAITESGSPADAQSSAATLAAAITESGTAAEVVSSGSTYPGTITESASPADTTSSVATLPGAITESGAASEAESAIGTFGVTDTESGSVADTVASTAVRPATVTEAGTAAETVGGTMVASAAITEAGTAVDSPSSKATLPSAISESAPISDSEQSVAPGTSTITEAMSAADTVSAQRVTVPAITEAATALDTQNSQSNFAAAITEGANASDLVSSLAVLAGIINESSPAADFPSTPGGNQSFISEFMTARDTVAALVFPLPFPDACRIAGQLHPVRLVDGPTDIVRTIARTDIVRTIVGTCC